MNEQFRKFTIEKTAIPSGGELEAGINRAYAAARDHEDMEVFGRLFSNVALFCDALLNTYSKEELIQVPAYHSLIRSGMPSAGAEEHQEKISDVRKEEIEDAIEAFVEEQYEALNLAKQ